MRNAKKEAARGGMIVQIAKGAVFASLISIALIVIYALLIQYEILSVDSISYVNTAIKLVGAAAASLIATRRTEERRWLVGAVAGAVYIAVAFLVFSLISGAYDVSLSLLADMGLGLIAGMLAAMIFQVIK